MYTSVILPVDDCMQWLCSVCMYALFKLNHVYALEKKKKKKNCWPKYFSSKSFFGPKIFNPKNFPPKYFSSKIFFFKLFQNTFLPKICQTQIFFKQKLLWTKNFQPKKLSTQIFFKQNFFWTTIFLTRFFFLNFSKIPFYPKFVGGATTVG